MSQWADMVEEDEESYPSLIDSLDKSKHLGSKAPRTTSVSSRSSVDDTHEANDRKPSHSSRENRYNTSDNSRGRHGHQERERRSYGGNQRNDRYSSGTSSSREGGGDRDRRATNNNYSERKPTSGGGNRGLNFVDHRASRKVAEPKGETVRGTVVTLRPDFGFAKVDSLKEDVFFHKSEMNRSEADAVAVGDDIEFYILEDDKLKGGKLRGSKVSITATVAQKKIQAKAKAILEGVAVQGIVDRVGPRGGTIVLADSFDKVSFSSDDVLPELTGEIPEDCSDLQRLRYSALELKTRDEVELFVYSSSSSERPSDPRDSRGGFGGRRGDRHSNQSRGPSKVAIHIQILPKGTIKLRQPVSGRFKAVVVKSPMFRKSSESGNSDRATWTRGGGKSSAIKDIVAVNPLDYKGGQLKLIPLEDGGSETIEGGRFLFPTKNLPFDGVHVTSPINMGLIKGDVVEVSLEYARRRQQLSPLDIQLATPVQKTDTLTREFGIVVRKCETYGFIQSSSRDIDVYFKYSSVLSDKKSISEDIISVGEEVSYDADEKGSGINVNAERVRVMAKGSFQFEEELGSFEGYISRGCKKSRKKELSSGGRADGSIECDKDIVLPPPHIITRLTDFHNKPEMKSIHLRVPRRNKILFLETCKQLQLVAKRNHNTSKDPNERSNNRGGNTEMMYFVERMKVNEKVENLIEAGSEAIDPTNSDETLAKLKPKVVDEDNCTSNITATAADASSKPELASVSTTLTVSFQIQDIIGEVEELGMKDKVKFDLVLIKKSNTVIARNIVLLEAAPVIRIQGIVSREIARPVTNLSRRNNKTKKHLIIGKIKADNGKNYSFESTSVGLSGIDSYTFRYGSRLEFDSKDEFYANNITVIEEAPRVHGIVCSAKVDFGFLKVISEEEAKAGPKPVSLPTKSDNKKSISREEEIFFHFTSLKNSTIDESTKKPLIKVGDHITYVHSVNPSTEKAQAVEVEITGIAEVLPVPILKTASTTTNGSANSDNGDVTTTSLASKERSVRFTKKILGLIGGGPSTESTWAQGPDKSIGFNFVRSTPQSDIAASLLSQLKIVVVASELEGDEVVVAVSSPPSSVVDGAVPFIVADETTTDTTHTLPKSTSSITTST